LGNLPLRYRTARLRNSNRLRYRITRHLMAVVPMVLVLYALYAFVR
jgi:hypothetical protein